MKHLSVCLLLLTVTFSARAEGPTLAEARTQWLKGHFDEARELYQELAREAKLRDAASLGISRTWQSQGEYDKALATIDGALENSPKNAELHARRAELLHLRGRWDDADKAVDRALALKKDNFLARWVRAQLHRDRGELAKADEACRWFVRTFTDRSDNDDDIKNPDELLLVGLAGCENARWNNISDQFEIILKDVYGDALQLDKNFWPAKYQAGMLYLEKYNQGDALPAFDKVLAINPHAAEAFVGKGVAALQKMDIKDAERFADQALKLNPNLVEALNLRADVYCASGAFGKALRELELASKVNPRDESMLGRIAACLYLQGKPEEFQKVLQEAERYDPRAGLFYYTLGESLEERRRFDDAEKYFKKSTELRPVLPWAQNSLGLLYMRMGREKEAEKILSQAYEADAFNVRVGNSLKVLRHLQKYETLKTPHFELRFDPQNDKHLAAYMARYLEEIYAELAEKFQYKPKGPILIEVFNNHEMFSGRVIALPDLHTIGACTGRMVAMVSPRSRDKRAPFNWARVLRHELVHIFNLEQTNFLVPHWYTEGLAVSNEGFPRPQPWNRMLLERVPSGELMNLDSIDLGFIRPRSPDDWHMAYCQSQLYVDYLKKTSGPEAVGALLNAYRDGLDTDAAINKVCKVSKAEFEKGYRAYLDEVVRSLKGKDRPAERAMTFRQLRDAQEKDPDNPDLSARLAELYLKRDKAAARKLADAALARKQGHPLASYVKAQLLRAAGDDEEALKLLEAIDPKALPEPKVVALLGKLYFDAAKFDKAAEVFERAHTAEPHESRWMSDLVRVYAQTGDKRRRIQILKDLVPTDADDLDSRKLLAQMLVEAENYTEAEQYARQALEIDVLDAGAEQSLGDALAGKKKFAEAIETYQLVVSLLEKEKAFEHADDVRVKLARAYHESGEKEKALAEVNRVLARDAKHPEAKKLQRMLDK